MLPHKLVTMKEHAVNRVLDQRTKRELLSNRIP